MKVGGPSCVCISACDFVALAFVKDCMVLPSIYVHNIADVLLLATEIHHSPSLHVLVS